MVARRDADRLHARRGRRRDLHDEPPTARTPVDVTNTAGTDLALRRSRRTATGSRSRRPARAPSRSSRWPANGTGQDHIVTTAPVGVNAPDGSRLQGGRPGPHGDGDPPPRRRRPRRPRPPGGGGGGAGGGGGGLAGALFDGGGPPATTCAKSSVRFGDVEVLASCFSAQGPGPTWRRAGSGSTAWTSRPSAARSRSTPSGARSPALSPSRCSPGAIPLHIGRIAWDLSSGRLELPIGGGRRGAVHPAHRHARLWSPTGSVASGSPCCRGSTRSSSASPRGSARRRARTCGCPPSPATRCCAPRTRAASRRGTPPDGRSIRSGCSRFAL